MSVSEIDVVSRKCVELFCSVIQLAAADVKRDSSARRFFEDHRSPFWDYCDHLQLKGDLIAKQALSVPCVPRKR
jgi:hypothetical protein